MSGAADPATLSSAHSTLARGPYTRRFTSSTLHQGLGLRDARHRSHRRSARSARSGGRYQASTEDRQVKTKATLWPALVGDCCISRCHQNWLDDR